MIAADPAFVGDAGEPAGAGQHCQQRQFRQRHRRRAVIDEHDVIGRQRQFVTAAGGSAVDRADRFDARILAEILDTVAGLVGELAEIHLMRMARAGQHANIGTRRKHPRFGRAQHQHPHAGMFEPQPIDRVGQFDIDAEIVGIELEIVAFEQRRFFVDVHHQRRDFAVDLELPMAIARRLGLKIDPHALVDSLVRVAAALARKCMICLAHRGLGRSASTASAKL